MTTSDWVMVFAILLAPLIAVQVTQYLDRKRQSREAKIKIFSTLMATRAATVSPGHVEALNMIDVVFHKGSAKDRAVVSSWHEYLDHLGDKTYPRETWGTRRIELFVDLLYVMAGSVGYSFDKTHIKNTIYYPEAHGQLEDDQFLLRKGVLGLLKGELALPVALVERSAYESQGQANDQPTQPKA